MSSTKLAALLVASGVVVSAVALAAGKYDPGASDTEIKIGQTISYSGPLSAFGAFGGAPPPSKKTVTGSPVTS